MPIAKSPFSKTKMTNKQAKKFILAASTEQSDNDERFVQTPIRFPPDLLLGSTPQLRKRAKRSWLRYAATKEIDVEDL